ncbi:hypothetical protein [Hominenteromicrobium sp.]|uniref:hypothetical protein n=1 Tax=Hominenteromicrobium sp. TaxID=3073581 RepID=UPI003AB2BAF7
MNPLSRPVRDKPGNEKIPQPKPQDLFTLFYLYKFAFFSKLAYRIAAIPDVQMVVIHEVLVLSCSLRISVKKPFEKRIFPLSKGKLTNGNLLIRIALKATIILTFPI